jgi:cytochrome c peroxidase
MKKLVVIIILFFSIAAFKVADNMLLSFPSNWPKPVYDFSKNALSTEKVELGRLLFYDPLLSVDNTISCASCHSPFTAFTHVDHSLSHGINDRIGKRNSPALMNLAWGKLFMWDGAVNNLDMQALAPISHADEMGETMANVVAKLQGSKRYPALFLKAFGDSTVTGANTLKAISQFLLTLVSANAKYDSVMRKEGTFTQQEKNGYKLFKQHCSSCHQEPLFTSNQFENNGLALDTGLNDFGRMSITNNPADSLKFKVPTLRNIQFSNPYMHDGRFSRLSEVMKHYTSGIQHSKTLSAHLKKPIRLSADEKVDITAFLLHSPIDLSCLTIKLGFRKTLYYFQIL